LTGASGSVSAPPPPQAASTHAAAREIHNALRWKPMLFTPENEK
jgi:hypothetical protein